jgi:DNA-directed RNA polymerase specialized sigma24 family protein
MPVGTATDLDRLVARAQAGDVVALEALCARARPMLLRHARRLLGRSGDVEDAVQDALILACARLRTYRWEGTFAGWLYALATRSMLRRRARTPQDATFALELADDALLSDHDPMTEGEWRLIEQDLHLACTVGVLTALSPETRRLYLLGEVLAVPDSVGAEVAQVTPAAYRKRLERARRAVAEAVRSGVGAPTDCAQVAAAARELDDLVRLGELHRVHARRGTASGALRALTRVAPTLAA